MSMVWWLWMILMECILFESMLFSIVKWILILCWGWWNSMVFCIILSMLMVIIRCICLIWWMVIMIMRRIVLVILCFDKRVWGMRIIWWIGNVSISLFWVSLSKWIIILRNFWWIWRLNWVWLLICWMWLIMRFMIILVSMSKNLMVWMRLKFGCKRRKCCIFRLVVLVCVEFLMWVVSLWLISIFFLWRRVSFMWLYWFGILLLI